MSDKIKCPSCGKEIKATAKFCGFCATKIEARPINVETNGDSEMVIETPVGKVCTSCGRKAAKGKFCGVCGGTLVDDTRENYTEDEPKDIPVVLSGVPARKRTDEFIDVDGLDKEIPKNDETKMPTATTNIHSDFKPAGELE